MLHRAAIFIMLILFPAWQSVAGENDFHRVFIKEFEFSLKKDKHNVAYFRGLTVDKRGNCFIIDFASKQIFKFDRDGNIAKIIGGPGKGPGEFEAPMAITIDKTGNIYVSDNSLRRISIFDNEGNFLRSFVIAVTHWIPQTMRVGSNGHIFMAGLMENFEKPLTGTWIHKYDSKGKLITSFYPVEDFSRKHNTSYHSRARFDIDAQDNIYAIQDGVGILRIYNPEGKFVNSFETNSEHFIPPPMYPDPHKWARLSTNVKESYHDSWTHWSDIVVTPDGLILTSLEIKGASNALDKNYVINIYDRQGNLKASNLTTNFRLLFADQNRFVYFLTSDDKEINKEPQYSIGKFKINLEVLK